VFTDSQYVINGIEKGWAHKWKLNNWYRNKNDKAINYDLWDRLLILIATHERVTFNWVKGHAGHVENERCDELAFLALNGDNLLVDTGYDPNNRKDEKDNGLNLDGSFKNAKVKEEGDLCKKCRSIVIKRDTKKKIAKPGQTYYFDYYLFCPSCKTMYMVEDAKRDIGKQEDNLFS
jgi:hypothetical protein